MVNSSDTQLKLAVLSESYQANCLVFSKKKEKKKNKNSLNFEHESNSML